MRSSYRAHLMSCAMMAVGLQMAPAAFAQVEDAEDDTAVQETVIVTGARGAPRSVTDSPVPIDVFGADDIEAVSFTDVELQLLPDNRIKLLAKANWGDRTIPVSLYCTLEVAKRRRVRFNDIQFEPQDIPDDVKAVSQQLTDALGSILNEMVDLDRFDLDGVKMRLNRLETQGKVLLFSGYAQIEKVPNK